MAELNLISLFSGAGGMDLGFKNAGFNIIWANDFEKDAVKTYQRNIGNHIVLGDITQIDSSEIPGSSENVDVIIGGFPCQGFSIANTKRNMEDSRNFLYLELLRVIKDKKPKFFVAENVKGLLSMEKGKVLQMILEDFTKLGYDVDYKVLNAADFGVPQARERIIIMGNRIGVNNPFPHTTHGDFSNNDLLLLDTDLKPYNTVENAIGFLSEVELMNGKTSEYIIVGDRKIYNHVASTKVEDTFFGRKYEVNQAEICDYLKMWRDKSDWTTKKIDEHFGYRHTAGHWFRKDNSSGSIPKPSDWWELKKILEFDDTYDKQVTTFVEKPILYEQSLRITNWDRPSDTITATSPEIHINKKRRLSARECAILQTFPDDFIFEGSLSSLYRQIGNAVPVLLAEKIAKQIADLL
ncbi:DNA cytosine methyltransferase (plasmid) [Vagococcus lutrae]|uniref:DNA cytosine methyltransferase n=1 Tax=Vagococcus lutrae TaxID=81947 RepID=UPI00200F47CE|nr:DNA cytosine methyltransferase [Vagococcus lutrae]UQF72085.1 DNA cytosine methyltransferase [Vagococcus lutrae]